MPQMCTMPPRCGVGFAIQVCVSALSDVHTMMKLPIGAFIYCSGMSPSLSDMMSLYLFFQFISQARNMQQAFKGLKSLHVGEVVSSQTSRQCFAGLSSSRCSALGMCQLEPSVEDWWEGQHTHRKRHQINFGIFTDLFFNGQPFSS